MEIGKNKAGKQQCLIVIGSQIPPAGPLTIFRLSKCQFMISSSSSDLLCHFISLVQKGEEQDFERDNCN